MSCYLCQRLAKHLQGWETVYCPLCEKQLKERNRDPVKEQKDQMLKFLNKFKTK